MDPTGITTPAGDAPKPSNDSDKTEGGEPPQSNKPKVPGHGRHAHTDTTVHLPPGVSPQKYDDSVGVAFSVNKAGFAVKEVLKLRTSSLPFKELMSDWERLNYHKTLSLPIMKSMKDSLEEMLANKIVEPNSNLGQAINYFTKRYEKLIGFCLYPGVPIDNNECEQTIKRFVLFRKSVTTWY